MSYYPIAIDIAGRKCLIVGGGAVALRKAKSLLDAGARVVVVAPDVDERLASLDGVEVLTRTYRRGDVSGCALVFAATNDRAVNASVAEDARSCGAPVNVVDDPELCSFIAPAVVKRGDLLIAVTTSGKSPALSRRIRMEIEERYGPEYAALVEMLGELRDIAKEKYSSEKDRRRVLMRVLDSDVLDLLRQGKTVEARRRALECLI